MSENEKDMWVKAIAALFGWGLIMTAATILLGIGGAILVAGIYLALPARYIRPE